MKAVSSIPLFKSPSTGSLYRNVRLYTRGFNAQGQLGLGNKLLSSEHFQEVPSFRGLEEQGLGITHLAVDHSQNIVVLNDSQVVHWGWPPCPLTTYRTLWVSHIYPYYPRIVHRFFPFFWQAIDSPKHDFFFDDLFAQDIEDNDTHIGVRVEKLSIGWGFSAALLSDLNVYGWGNNDSGQFGTRDTTFRAFPVKLKDKQIQGTSMKDVVCGYQHLLMLSQKGEVFGVGRSKMYQMGGEKLQEDKHYDMGTNKRGGIYHLQLPEPMAKLAAGKNHTLLLGKDSGTVYALGDNRFAQAGKNTVDYPVVEEALEVIIPGDERVVDIAAGQFHSLALTESGEVWGWGSKQKGQIDGNSEDGISKTWQPIKVDLPQKIVKIQAANVRSAAVGESGKVYFWGGFFYRQQERRSYYFPRTDRLMIIGINQVQQEEGLEIREGEEVAQLGLGFAHDVVAIGERVKET